MDQKQMDILQKTWHRIIFLWIMPWTMTMQLHFQPHSYTHLCKTFSIIANTSGSQEILLDLSSLLQSRRLCNCQHQVQDISFTWTTSTVTCSVFRCGLPLKFPGPTTDPTRPCPKTWMCSIFHFPCPQSVNSCSSKNKCRWVITADRWLLSNILKLAVLFKVLQWKL